MKPFRWSIAKREQLGSLVENVAPLAAKHQAFLTEIREAAARVVAMSDDADLAFIGRTPENFFDYLSGIFSDVRNAPCLHLVHFSLRWPGEGGVQALEPQRLRGFFDYLAEEGMDARALSTAPRPLALIDYVAYGGTMQSFVELLHLQAARDGVDWNAVQRRLRIVGLTVRKHNSPNTWRWQQHQTWLHLIPDAMIKNVSASASLLHYLAGEQPKVTHSYHPGRWGEDGIDGIPLTDDQLQALALAVALFETGLHREERQAFAACLAEAPEMRQASTRRLVSRLKGL